MKNTFRSPNATSSTLWIVRLPATSAEVFAQSHRVWNVGQSFSPKPSTDPWKVWALTTRLSSESASPDLRYFLWRDFSFCHSDLGLIWTFFRSIWCRLRPVSWTNTNRLCGTSLRMIVRAITKSCCRRSLVATKPLNAEKLAKNNLWRHNDVAEFLKWF